MNAKRSGFWLIALLAMALVGGLVVLVIGGGAARETRHPVVLAPPAPVVQRRAAADNLPGARSFVVPAQIGTPDSPLTPAQERALRRLAERLERGDKSLNHVLKPLCDWAERDPAACARWVLETLDGTARSRCLEEVIAVWTRQRPPQEALAWLDRQNELSTNRADLAGAYTLAVSALAWQDGAGAAEWLRSHAAQGSEQNWEAALGAWATTNPAGALQWMAAEPIDAGFKALLLPSLLVSFHDPGIAETLLRGSSASVADRALTSAVQATAAGDPDFSLALARQIHDQEVGRDAINRTLERWLENDAPAARLYAGEHGLTLPVTANEGTRLYSPALPAGVETLNGPPVPSP